MGNPRNSYLWYYAICTTGCTDSMHGISRFNGIFCFGRRKNYQTSSIPSRLAPMILFFQEKNEDYACAIWILSNNSMALRVRYAKIVFFFQNHSIMYRKSSMNKGVFTILSDISGAYFSVTNFFVFGFHTIKLLTIFMLWKNMKKKLFITIWKKKKETFGLLNNKWDKIRKQRNHHSI